jgi:putative dehydrogenase
MSLKGRSPESRARVERAALPAVEDDAELVRDAEFVLSIVPPGAAVSVAERFRTPLSEATRAPTFVDCNPVSPATAQRIGRILDESRCNYVDAGIIGGPPRDDVKDPGPRFYASGPHAREFSRLTAYGLDISVLDAAIGAASALKLSYAGLTKGITALGAAMVEAAMRSGLGDALMAELFRSQPQILKRVAHQVPAMFPKAYRWIAEMEEIADFLETDQHGAGIYRGAARLYEEIAAENEKRNSSKELATLIDFCRAARKFFT